MKKYLEYLTQVTQGQVLNLTQAEQGLEFVFSLFCVSTWSTEQRGYLVTGIFLLLSALRPGFWACFWTLTKSRLSGAKVLFYSLLVECQVQWDPDPGQDLWLKMKHIGKVYYCPLELPDSKQQSVIS